MPVQDVLTERVQTILAFMETPATRVLAVRHDPDLRQPLLRILLGFENDDSFRHVLVYSDSAFDDLSSYLDVLLDDLRAQVDLVRPGLEELEISLPEPSPPPAAPERTPAALATRLSGYFSDLAGAMPEEDTGSVVLILDPKQISHEEGFAWVIEALALTTSSDRAKYLVLDRRGGPILGDVEARVETVLSVEFHAAPEEIEAQVAKDLAGGKLNPAETRAYLAMAGAFAASAGRREEAEGRQLEALRLAQAEGSPTEQANALYNLGNTHLEQGRLPEAEDSFLRAAQLCIEHQVNPLLALVLTNLGVALHRQGRSEEARESFDVARRTFKALNNPPGEAHVLDNKARVHLLEDRLDEAEGAWLEALGVYQGITAPQLADVRSSGMVDIQTKLERFYRETNQAGKLRGLATEEE